MIHVTLEERMESMRDPREVLNHFQISIKEMNRAKAFSGLCCGAGGGQMFKEDEPGTEENKQ